VSSKDAAAIILPPPRVDPYRGPPPHEKGPLVFLDYDQIELDAAYDQAVYQPNILQLNKRWASNSARTRARIGAPLRRAYGESAIEQLDIFRADQQRADLHLHPWRRVDTRLG
jgi:arylformamidase